MSKSSVDNPKPRDLASELFQTYYGQASTAQPYFNLESFFQPKYGQIALGNQFQNLFGYDVPQRAQQPAPQQQPAAQPPPLLNRHGRPRRNQPAPTGPNSLFIPGAGHPHNFNDPYADTSGNPSQTPGHHPGQLEMGAAANTYQRASDIGDIARLGPAAQQAFLAANPFLASSLTNLMGRTEDSPILQTLNSQAQQALNAGGQLSPQEQAAADQQALSASASAGMAHGNPAIAGQILNRDAYSRQRAAAAQQFGMGVQGLNMNQADLVGRAAQIASTTLSDPFQAILGRPSGAGNGTGGYPQQIGTGARIFDPTNPYAQDIYNTNYNAQAASNIANANNQAAGQNAGIGAIGSIIGAVLPALFSASDERIKKNIRKTGEKTATGIPIKTFSYKTDPAKRKYRGVMAQDVERVRPGAVLTDPVSGLKAVNYAAAGAPFEFLTAT